MGKVTLNNPPQAKKILAVIGEDGNGIYFRRDKDQSFYLNTYKGTVTPNDFSLETLAAAPRRYAVYEGDSISIDFGEDEEEVL